MNFRGPETVLLVFIEVVYMNYKNELYHHGIKGQKWGVRRFQNSDGSYTAAGRKRRSWEGEKRSFENKKTERGKKIAATHEWLVRGGANPRKQGKVLTDSAYDKRLANTITEKDMKRGRAATMVIAAAYGAVTMAALDSTLNMYWR